MRFFVFFCLIFALLSFPKSNVLSQTVLHSSNNISLGSQSQVVGGPVFAQGRLIMRHQSVLTGDAFVGDNFYLGALAEIVGDAYVAGEFVGHDDALLTGGLFLGGFEEPVIELPEIEYVEGEDNVLISPFEDEVLDPGSYHHVTVDLAAILRLSGGTYYINRLSVKSVGQLIVEAPSVVVIGDRFKVFDRAQVVSGDDDYVSDFLTVYSNCDHPGPKTDNVCDFSLGDSCQFCLSTHSEFNGVIQIPDSPIRIREGAVVHGEIIARNIVIERDAVVEWHPPVCLPVEEICGDGIDQDCDGFDPECLDPEDSDDDGDGMTEAEGDCDDTNPLVYLEAEEFCDFIDNDCDLEVDEGLECLEEDLLPPDPEDIAPEVDGTVVGSVPELTKFLYEGDDPVQVGVEEGSIDDSRASVIRGSVLTDSGLPLMGVTVTVKDHPEWGSTLTRADGRYDFAVNGGQLLVFEFQKSGYLRVQRHIQTPQKDYKCPDPVVLLEYDPVVTAIDLTEGEEIQVAQGSVIVDDDGTRQVTLLIKPDTTAEVEYDDGRLEPLDEIHVRATEYTVGEDGPLRMPGDLPISSGYTYAVELSIDEVIDGGAKDVHFSEPVSFYVDNFLEFPAGMPVPLGYYDYDRAAWIPAQNGLVIQILSIDPEGVAQIDVDGTGVAASDEMLLDLGIDEDEQRKLGELYESGTSLWRMMVTHFTPWDCNWPYAPPLDARGPDLDINDSFGDDLNKPNERCGSIIECENQVLGETIDLPGTDFTLNYRSNRVEGKVEDYTIDIPLSDSELPESLVRIELDIEIAGRRILESFEPEPDQRYVYVWDGLDAYGRRLGGRQIASIRVGYVYQVVYLEPNRDFEQAFAIPGVSELDAIRGRDEVVLWQNGSQYLGVWESHSQGLGGWSLSSHHVYDPSSEVVYYGSGETQKAQDKLDVITTVAGNGEEGLIEEGVLATQSPIGSPIDVAVSPDGEVYFVTDDELVVKINSDKTLSIVAGNGRGVDGEAAIGADLSDPVQIEFDSDGNLYIADQGHYRVRKVSLDGIITTVAGTGIPRAADAGYHETQIPATDYDFQMIMSIALDSENNLYIAEARESYSGSQIVKVDRDGLITNFAGSEEGPFRSDDGDDEFALGGHFNLIHDITFDGEGNLYIVDRAADVRKISTAGRVSTVVGVSSGGSVGDEAEDYQPSGYSHLAFNATNQMYISQDYHNVVKVTDNLLIEAVAGSLYLNGFKGERSAATSARLDLPMGIAFDGAGNLYIADKNNKRLRRVSETDFSSRGENKLILNRARDQVHEFDPQGRHIYTRHPLTGAILYEFVYNESGLLVEIVDGHGNTTVLERDEEGHVETITGPHGHINILEIDDNDLLEAVITPGGEITSMTYYESKQLHEFTNRAGHTSTMTYNESGRLINDENPVGGYKALSSEFIDGAQVVTLSTAMGYDYVYAVTKNNDRSRLRQTTNPAGFTVETFENYDGSVTYEEPNRLTDTIEYGADPRFGSFHEIVTQRELHPGTGSSFQWEMSIDAELTDPSDVFSVSTLTQTYDINDQVFTSVYDATLQTITQTSPEDRQEILEIDDYGRPVSMTVTDIEPIHYEYDEQGRLTDIVQGTGLDERRIVLTYKDDGQIDTITDPLSRVLTYTHNDNGQVETVTDDAGSVTLYGYNELGQFASITPPGKPEHGHDYNALSLMSEYTPPSLGLPIENTLKDYNIDGQIDLITLPDGRSVDFVYESFAERIEEILFSRGSLSYVYLEESGQIDVVVTPEGNILRFDFYGPLLNTQTWEGDVEGFVQIDHDANFLVDRMTIWGGGVFGDWGEELFYDYDEDNLLTGIGPGFVVTRNESNRLIDATALNRVIDDTDYNAFGEVDNYTASADEGLSTIASFDYEYDKLGRITEIVETIDSETTTHTYDYHPVTGALMTVDSVGAHPRFVSYDYDENGNRNVFSDGILVLDADDIEIDSQDRLLDYGEVSFGYNATGQLETKTTAEGDTVYHYDEFNNLNQVDLPDGREVWYAIDGRDRRIQKQVDGVVVGSFLYQDQLNVVAELDADHQIVSQFVYGTKSHIPDFMIKGDDWYRIISDHLGSPRLVIHTVTGELVQKMRFDEFGNVLEDTNPGFQPFGFAGGLYDSDTKLLRFGARDYDPAIGRWTTKDPLLFEGGSSNLYVYAANDPINFLDLNGLWTAGIDLTVSFSAFGAGFSYGIGVAFDDDGNIGFISHGGGGGNPAAMASGSAMLSFQGTNADTINDLGGCSLTTGASANLGAVDVSGGMINADKYDGFYFGVGKSVDSRLPGLPVEVSSTLEYATVTAF